MAHVQKFSRGALGHLLAHYDRRKGGSESLIDPERSDLNYNLAKDIQPLDQLEYIHKLLDEVRCLKRKDVNVLCDWVITAPKDLPEDKQEEFFNACFEFLVTKYGKKCVVSAFVHMDETTPHMHFAFVPLVWDGKRNCLKVSAKDKINLRELKRFHDDLDKFVSSKMGFKVNVLNGATKDGNKSIQELKRGTAIEELKEIEERLFAHKARVKSLELKIQVLTRNKSESEDEIAFLEQTKLRLKKMCDDLQKQYDELAKNPPQNIDYKELSEIMEDAFFSIVTVAEQHDMLPRLEKLLKENGQQDTYERAFQMLSKARSK